MLHDVCPYVQNLGKDPQALKWYVQAELVHCRTAMAGAAGILIPSVRPSRLGAPVYADWAGHNPRQHHGCSHCQHRERSGSREGLVSDKLVKSLQLIYQVPGPLANLCGLAML